jgi:hypothetical protein
MTRAADGVMLTPCPGPAGTAPVWHPLRTGAVDEDVVNLADGLVAAPSLVTFPSPGRSAWYAVPGTTTGLKLKGIGYWSGDGAVRPPSVTSAFVRPHGHVGLTDGGALRVVASPPAPLGGITLDRGQCEFNSLDRVCGAIGPRPVRLYRWDGDDAAATLCVVVSLAPTAWPYRADLVFADPRSLSGPREEFARSVVAPLGLASTLRLLAAGYGAALRRLTDAGLFRHSGSVDNWGIAYERWLACPDPSAVFLTDLDSLRELDEASERRRPLEVLRDVASGLFNAAAAMMLPHGRAAGALDRVEATEILVELCHGYFPEVDRALCVRTVQRFVGYWWPLATRSWTAMTQVSTVERSIWMDRDLSFCLLMTSLAELYARSAAVKRWGDVDAIRLDAAVADFVGPHRFARLCRLRDQC